MRRISLTMVLVLFSLLLASTLSAQQAASASVPNLIRYTGTLKNAEGSVISSSAPVGVTFAIYKQQDGGAAVWQEIQNVAPDINGQYSVLLGSTTATGLPDDLFSSQDERWLGVQVQGQEEQARVLLVSVPYAFKAHEADTLGGLPASAFVQATPSTAPGSAASGTGATVNPLGTVASTGTTPSGTGPSAKRRPGPCTPQPGYLTYWDSTGALCASSLLQIANGNIGIGVTNPSEPLDVQGAISTYTWYDIYEQPVLTVGNPASASSTNLFVGFFAGNGTSSGTNDTFVGRESAYNNSSGSFDSFYGYRSGYHNTTGGSNTLIGYQAGFENNTGGSNTYVGRSSAFKGNGSNNVCVGYAACYNNTANDNTFVGTNAGVANTSGNQNVFSGFQTGFANTTGGSNVFVGYNAGQANIDQSYNTFVGANAGYSSDVGGNTLIGYSAGSNTNSSTGYGIVATGYDAGRSNSTGTFNAYFGANAGFNGSLTNFTTGSDNTYLGNGAGSSTNLTSGSNNIFVGFAAGNAENNVSNNIEIGFSGPISTGSNTTVIGTPGVQTAVFLAGIAPSPPSGANTVYVSNGQLFQGPASGGGVTGTCTPPLGGNYITQWLTMASVGCSGIFQQNTTNFIGIGTITPSVALDVNGDISANSPTSGADRSSYQIAENTVLSAYGDRNIIVGFTGAHATNATQQNTIVGANAGQNITSGDWNVFMGSAAGYSTVGGYENVFIGQEAGRDNVNGTDNTYIGEFAGTVSNTSGSYNTYVGEGTGQNNNNGSSNIYLMSLGTNESNTIRIGSQGTGNGQQNATYVAGVYSATSESTGQTVCVGSDGKLWGVSGTCPTTSSRRFKQQIADMGDSSSKLFQLRPVTFFYKPQYDDGSHHLQYGLIAEEVAKVYPQMAVYDKDGQASGVKYDLLAPMLLNELQKEHAVVMSQQEELQSQLQQINSQRQEINSLKHDLQLQNASLQERLDKLESYVATQMKTASDVHPAATTATNGESQ